jgi:hypothetical protein
MENWSTTQTTLVLLLMVGFVCFVIYFGLNIKRVEKGKLTLGKALLGETNYSKKYGAIGFILGIIGSLGAYPLTIMDLILGALVGGGLGFIIGRYRES